MIIPWDMPFGSSRNPHHPMDLPQWISKKAFPPGGWCEVHGRGADFLFSVPGGAEGFLRWVYPLVITNIAIENDHRNSGFSHWKWWFSIVMLVYQRVPVADDLAKKRCRRSIGESIEGVCYILRILYIYIYLTHMFLVLQANPRIGNSIYEKCGL